MQEEELDFSGDRSASLKLISWFDIERVRSARVLVVGAGAIGNEVLKNLALMGVGEIRVIDLDTIEMSNLSRSVLFRAEDNGKKKARAAAEAVKAINPEVAVRWHDGDIETDLGEGLLREFDVVLSCLDSVYARYVLNRRCLRAGVPWVDAGIGTLDGQVQVFVPGEVACYECTFTEAHYERALNRLPNSCNAIAAEARKEGRAPTTVMVASIVAAIQVQECLKLLDRKAWGDRTFVGRRFSYSGTHALASTFSVPRRDDCPAHEVEADWSGEVPRVLPLASARMSLAEFLAHANSELGEECFLALEDEFVTGYVCPECGQESKRLVAMHKAIASALSCSCGWRPTFQSDLASTHLVSPRAANSEYAAYSLLDFGIPIGGFAELHGKNRSVHHVVLGADLASECFWR